MSENVKLNIRQKAFADNFIISGNATEAAIQAGYSSKYAGQNADKLLKNTKVQQYIEKRMTELDDERIAKQEEVLKYLTRVMRREEREYQVVTISKKESRWVKGEDGKPRKETFEEETAEIVPIPARLSDSNKAAELLGKRYGLFNDDVTREKLKIAQRQLELREIETFGIDETDIEDDGILDAIDGAVEKAWADDET